MSVYSSFNQRATEYIYIYALPCVGINRGRSGNKKSIRFRRLIKVPVPDRPTEGNAVIPAALPRSKKADSEHVRSKSIILLSLPRLG